MASIKLAKLLNTTSDFSNLPDDDCWLLVKESGTNKGIRISYRDNGTNIRTLAPLEEYERWYSFDNMNRTETLPASIVIDKNFSSIVTINSTAEISDLTVTLPKIDETQITNGIYFTYNVRFAIDANTKGFTIIPHPDNTSTTIFGSSSLIVKKQNTTFDMYLGPDNKWRIVGLYENISGGDGEVSGPQLLLYTA